MQPQTWASGGVEGSIERSKKILKQCDTNEPLLRARVRAAQERMNTAAGEERRAAHAVSSKASFSAQMATMKKRVIDANPSERLRELLAQEARAVEQVRERSAMGKDAKALVTATGKGISFLQKALGCCLEAKVLHEQVRGRCCRIYRGCSVHCIVNHGASPRRGASSSRPSLARGPAIGLRPPRPPCRDLTPPTSRASTSTAARSTRPTHFTAGHAPQAR